jgi:hypothetical protein
MLNPFENALTHRAFSVVLLFGTLMLISNLSPDCAFGQSSTKSATGPIASDPNKQQSSPVAQGESQGMKVFALRLRPGQDLRKEIENFTREKGIKAGFIITTVGSLEKVTLRLADQKNPSSFEGKFEIVSLVPKFANAVEEPTESKGNRTNGLLDEVSIGSLKIRPSSPPNELSDIRFDPAIRLLAKRDWFGVQKVVDSIKDPVLRLSFKLELAKGTLLESGNRPTPTLTTSQQP